MVPTLKVCFDETSGVFFFSQNACLLFQYFFMVQCIIQISSFIHFLHFSIIVLHFFKISSSHDEVINGFVKPIYKSRVMYNISGILLTCSIKLGSSVNRFSNPFKLFMIKNDYIGLVQILMLQVLYTYQQIDLIFSFNMLHMHV